jgi:hypothetical protein
MLAELTVSWEVTSPSIWSRSYDLYGGNVYVILHVLMDFRIYTPNYGTSCNTKSH